MSGDSRNEATSGGTEHKLEGALSRRCGETRNLKGSNLADQITRSLTPLRLLGTPNFIWK